MVGREILSQRGRSGGLVTGDNEQEPSLAREVTFDNPIVLSDGIGSSGKRLLAHVAALLDGVEKLTHNPIFETVATLHWMGELRRDAAIAILRTHADQAIYHLMLAREVNLRPGETTSIWSNPRPGRYLRRLVRQPEGGAAAARIRGESPMMNEGTHDGMRSAPLFAEAFGTRLNLFHVLRHPADLAVDWLRRGFGTRIGEDEREFQLILRRGRGLEPLYFVHEEPGFYAQLDARARVLGMLAFCYEENLKGYRATAPVDVNTIRIYDFDEILTAPQALLDDLSDALGRPVRSAPGRTFRKERVPRRLIPVSAREGELTPRAAPDAARFYERCLEAFEALRSMREPLGRA